MKSTDVHSSDSVADLGSVDLLDRMSIAIPFHRLDSYLVNAIDSAAIDATAEDEILLINDSTRKSADVAAWLKSHDLKVESSLQFIENHIGGIVAARNLALQHSKNEVLSFLDSDDTWVIGRRDHHLSLLNLNPDVSGVSSNVRYVCSHGHELAESQIYHPVLLSMLGPISRFFPRFRTSSTTIKVSHAAEVGGFKDSEANCEDFGLWLRLQVHRGVILADKMVAANYTLHPDQVSHTLATKALETHKELTVAALKLATSASRAQWAAIRRITDAIDDGGILSWILGYSKLRPLRFIVSFSPRVLLLALYLHRSARAYRKSRCLECEHSNE